MRNFVRGPPIRQVANVAHARSVRGESEGGRRARVGGERATPARGNATHPPREAGILQLRTLLLGVVFPSLLVHGVRVFNVQGIVEFVDVVDVVVS